MAAEQKTYYESLNPVTMAPLDPPHVYSVKGRGGPDDAARKAASDLTLVTPYMSTASERLAYVEQNLPGPNILLRERGSKPPSYFPYSGIKMEKPEDDPSRRYGIYVPYVKSRKEVMKKAQEAGQESKRRTR